MVDCMSPLFPNGGPVTEVFIQVAPLRNSGRVPSIVSVPLLDYAAFINYNQYLSKHVIDMPYSYNSWRLKDLKN